jgi:hypothetical protein
MLPTAANIYHSILLRAADEWGVEYEDVERDIGQQFDPVVRFMAGACASELELVYQHLHNTERRLQERLGQVLLPEYLHLPQPAHALAMARPTDEPVMIDDATEFIREAEEAGKPIAFSPLWPVQLVPARLHIAATETRLLQLGRRTRLREATEAEEFRRLLLGFELPEPISNWQRTSLYFDLRNSSPAERAVFLGALPASRCILNGRELLMSAGMPAANLLLEDYLNGNERLLSQVRARYAPHFLTFTEAELPETAPQAPAEFLPRWFAHTASAQEVEAQLAAMDTELTKPLYWLEIHLGYAVAIPQLDARLDLRFNVFPVANRRLCGAGKGEHHYLQNTTIKWLHLQPEEDFASIRRVYEEKAPEHPVFQFKPFADFKEGRSPSYTLRHGGVGRWDEFNAWQRLAYVVAVLQENYQHQELIQQAAASLSLEDVHHLLGKKIAETAAAKKPTRDIYVLLHSGATAGMRVRVEYWTSQGAAANSLAAKSALRCTSKAAASLDQESIELVTPTVDGRDPLNATEQIDAMKSALLSRGRLVTREDVRNFCREFLSDRAADLHVQDGVGLDPRLDFGMTRLLDVRVHPAPAAAKADWDGICRQLQTLLEQKSASSIPIRVSLMPR